MMAYPIYRKYQNGQEFHKIISDTEMISVYKAKYGYRIMITSNGMIRQDVLGDDVAMPSTRDEFEKAYGEAQWKLTQANNVQ